MKQKSQNSKAIHRRFKPLKTFIFSRIFIVSLLLTVQIGLFAFPAFAYYHSPAAQYALQLSALIGLAFSLYIVNSPGRNEFKIAWLIPVLIMPFFGIVLFLLFKKNPGISRFSKRLNAVKKYSRPFYSDINIESRALSVYPKVNDIAAYLKNNGGFSTFTETDSEYFSSGEAVFPRILEDLKKAEKFIFAEYFVIEESSMWASILEILLEKSKQGVEVYILFDSLGSVSLATRRYQRYLRSFGLNVKIFSPFVPVYDAALNHRDHRKLIDIDGKIAYTGGFNISDEYINLSHPRFDYWKDSALRLEGPAVRTFTVSFLQLWYVQNKKTELSYSDFDRFVNIPRCIKDKGGIVIPYCDDAYSRADVAEDVYNYILSKSHKYVHIMTPYLIIDNTMMNAMVFAAKRGVEVKIIVPSKYDHLLTFCVGRNFMRILINNGVRIYTYNKGFMHSKLFVSDDKRASVGSINLDYRSLFHHFECASYLYQTETIADIEMDFQETLKDCTEMTLSEYKKIPLPVRATGWMFKIFAPLL